MSCNGRFPSSTSDARSYPTALGASLALEALAKPLLRLLYDRQALAFIEKPLFLRSPMANSSWAQELRPATKRVMLRQARDGHLLECLEPRIVIGICVLLGSIASHEALSARVVECGSCPALLSLLERAYRLLFLLGIPLPTGMEKSPLGGRSPMLYARLPGGQALADG
ncbi:hypothetical protein C8J57DRAFT_1507016 [Mycena rebaudengoi]|nr:hypothetical protein C8J57DRAFT_1507016 [Mycena rebaudengoi]